MKRFWLAPAMLAAAVVYAGFDSESGLRTWWELRGALAEARGRIEDRQREMAALDAAARELDGEGDSFAMEEAIRVDLGLSRPDETIVLFDDPPGPSGRNP